MKIVLDTNILISGTFWTGKSYKILEKAEKNNIDICSSPELITEYYEKLKSDEIIEKSHEKNLVINSIIQKAISSFTIVQPKEKIDAIKTDPDDNIILECAIEAKVDYIISQDYHLLDLKEFRGIKILSPEDFLNLLK